MLVLNLQGSLRDTQAGLPTNHKDILLASVIEESQISNLLSHHHHRKFF